MIEPIEPDEDIYMRQDRYREKLVYRWSTAGQLQRRYIGLMRRGLGWWLKIGVLAGVVMGLVAGAVLLAAWGW